MDVPILLTEKDAVSKIFFVRIIQPGINTVFNLDTVFNLNDIRSAVLLERCLMVDGRDKLFVEFTANMDNLGDFA